jgi:hypothetical protein
MEFSNDEQKLIESARRRQRPSGGGIVLGVAVTMVIFAVGGLIADPGPDARARLSEALVWLMFGVTMHTYLKFRETALDVVAKLTGTYTTRQASPAVLGLTTPPERGAENH